MAPSATIWSVPQESLGDTLPLVPILLPVYLTLEYFSHRGGKDLVARLRITRRTGPLAGTLLGIIPQCGMSVLVTSFYLLKRVTTGTLVSTYLATSDEAIPVALFGLVPNCAISVAIVEMFLRGGVSPGAAIAGLSAGAGLGPILLVNDGSARSAARVLSFTLTAAVTSGLLVNWLSRAW